MWLGLDLGTSALKPLLLEADERVVKAGSDPLTVSPPRPTCIDQGPAPLAPEAKFDKARNTA